MRSWEELWGGANTPLHPAPGVCRGPPCPGAPPSTAQPSIYKTTQAHNTTLEYNASYSSTNYSLVRTGYVPRNTIAGECRSEALAGGDASIFPHTHAPCSSSLRPMPGSPALTP